MVAFGANKLDVEPGLIQARESIIASAQTPSELLGEPETYGRTAGQRLRPPVDVLAKDLLFRSLGGGIKILLLSLGTALTLLGIWIAVESGWNSHSTPGRVGMATADSRETTRRMDSLGCNHRRDHRNGHRHERSG